jgi:hypothetical protein
LTRPFNANSIEGEKIIESPIFLIGVAKSGTGSLSQLLYKHPSICHEELKEKNYFNRKPKIRYEDVFTCKNSSKINVDASPDYFSSHQCPKTIIDYYGVELFQKKKLILSLREPVSRMYSYYQFIMSGCFRVLNSTGRVVEHSDEIVKADTKKAHRDRYKISKIWCNDLMIEKNKPMLKNGSNIKSFAQFIKSDDPVHGLSTGNYYKHLQRWLQYVPRDHLFILNFHDLISNTTEVVKHLATFLNIDPQHWYTKVAVADHNSNNSSSSTVAVTYVDKILLPYTNRGKYECSTCYLDCETYDELFQHYSQENKDLVSYINSDRLKHKAEPIFSPFPDTRVRCVNSKE